MTYYDPAAPACSARADYSQWSIEELWQLASQLRVAGARNKNRRELLDLFAVPAATEAQRLALSRDLTRYDKELS